MSPIGVDMIKISLLKVFGPKKIQHRFLSLNFFLQTFTKNQTHQSNQNKKCLHYIQEFLILDLI